MFAKEQLFGLPEFEKDIFEVRLHHLDFWMLTIGRWEEYLASCGMKLIEPNTEQIYSITRKELVRLIWEFSVFRANERNNILRDQLNESVNLFGFINNAVSNMEKLVSSDGKLEVNKFLIAVGKILKGAGYGSGADEEVLSVEQRLAMYDLLRFAKKEEVLAYARDVGKKKENNTQTRTLKKSQMKLASGFEVVAKVLEESVHGDQYLELMASVMMALYPTRFNFASNYSLCDALTSVTAFKKEAVLILGDLCEESNYIEDVQGEIIQKDGPFFKLTVGQEALTCYKFLLMAYLVPHSKIQMSQKLDRICKFTRGGQVRKGKHCDIKWPNRRNGDLFFLGAIYDIAPTYPEVKLEDGGATFPMNKFFDQSFALALSTAEFERRKVGNYKIPRQTK